MFIFGVGVLLLRCSDFSVCYCLCDVLSASMSLLLPVALASCLLLSYEFVLVLRLCFMFDLCLVAETAIVEWGPRGWENGVGITELCLALGPATSSAFCLAAVLRLPAIALTQSTRGRVWQLGLWESRLNGAMTKGD